MCVQYCIIKRTQKYVVATSIISSALWALGMFPSVVQVRNLCAGYSLSPPSLNNESDSRQFRPRTRFLSWKSGADPRFHFRSGLPDKSRFACGSQTVTPPATLQPGEQKTKPRMVELVELGLLV